MSYKKKIKIFWQEGVREKQINIGIAAILLFILHANASGKVDIKKGKQLKFVDFKKEKGKYAGRLNADLITAALSKKVRRSYGLVLTHEELYCRQSRSLESAVGLASYSYDTAAVYTGCESNPANDKEIMGTVMHELGHLCGLKHCNDWCVMFPDCGIAPKLDLTVNAFCPVCLKKLRAFFG